MVRKHKDDFDHPMLSTKGSMYRSIAEDSTVPSLKSRLHGIAMQSISRWIASSWEGCDWMWYHSEVNYLNFQTAQFSDIV